LEPSRNWTEPVGVPEDELSAAVKMTLSPTVDGLRELVRVSEVPHALTVPGYAIKVHSEPAPLVIFGVTLSTMVLFAIRMEGLVGE
jgi:hypothetical protein